MEEQPKGTEQSTKPTAEQQNTPVVSSASASTSSTATAGPNGPFPAELKHWNWGAFFLTWVWGIGNSVWISLLTFVAGAFAFIPFVGWLVPLAFAIFLGVKGNEYAWKQRRFESVEEFKRIQKAWAVWGLIIWLVCILGLVLIGSAVVKSVLG